MERAAHWVALFVSCCYKWEFFSPEKDRKPFKTKVFVWQDFSNSLDKTKRYGYCKKHP